MSNLSANGKNLPRRRPLRVVAVAYQRQSLFELGIVSEVFDVAAPAASPPLYDFRIVQADPGRLSTQGGAALVAAVSLKPIAQADVVIIPGWRNHDESPPAALITSLVAAHSRGARIVSICTGAFVLAAAGLLNGRRATTHWRFAGTLQSQYPLVRVDANALFVDEGPVLTSAGSAAGIDACLHLVRKDYGAAVANQIARRIVAAPYRSGGQSQFIEEPVPPEGSDRIGEVMNWALRRLGRGITVTALAARCALSYRSFVRRFASRTGMGAKEWLIRQRVARARELLESTNVPLSVVCERCGFGSVESLRLNFRKHVRISPAEYRRSFRFPSNSGLRRRSRWPLTQA